MAANQKVGELAKCTVWLAPRHLTLFLFLPLTLRIFLLSPRVPLAFARSPLFPLTPSLSLSLQNLSRINWFDPDVSSREIPIGHRIVTPLALFALSLAFLPPFPLLYALQDQDNPFSPGSPEIPNIHQSYVIERFRRPCKSSSRESSRKKRASWSFNESLQRYTSERATAIESISLSKDISAIIIEWGNQTLNVSF